MSENTNKHLDDDEAFRRYREQMHPEESDADNTRHKPGSVMRSIFGIFMIIIYIGMGILCITNFFGYPATDGWTIGRWVVGVVLIIYGIWRGYRQFAGIDSRI